MNADNERAIVEFENVCKCFDSKKDASRSLASFLWSGLRGEPTVPKWALQGIDLKVMAGERIAILGHNGAGKSTLLRMIANTLAPTLGRVSVRGSVAPLLGATAGFDPRLSGSDNATLRACMFGLHRSDIQAVLPEIVAFAELEDAIDFPIETYSSGMVARLGFAISIHLQADIYLIDEVMSAGDGKFRKKARRAMNEKIQEGGTWIIVTHDLKYIDEFCNRGYLLENGRISAQGALSELMPEGD